jgi:hypothetical protein
MFAPIGGCPDSFKGSFKMDLPVWELASLREHGHECFDQRLQIRIKE